MLMRAADEFVQLRRHEFGRLDATGSVYLAAAGAALYPASLVRRDARRPSASVNDAMSRALPNACSEICAPRWPFIPRHE